MGGWLRTHLQRPLLSAELLKGWPVPSSLMMLLGSSLLQVWDCSGAGYVRYRAADAGRTVMGHVAENAVLQAALMHCLRRPGSNAELMWPVSAGQDCTTARLPATWLMALPPAAAAAGAQVPAAEQGLCGSALCAGRCGA